MASTVKVIEAPVKALLGDIINPGDEVITLTQVYGIGTNVCFGIYRGVVEPPDGKTGSIRYAVDRPHNGKRSYLRFATNIVRKTITLAELEGLTI